jgi:hypothetical protein
MACSTEGTRRLAAAGPDHRSPGQPWPLSQHANSRGCRSDAERVQMVWRCSPMRAFTRPHCCPPGSCRALRRVGNVRRRKPHTACGLLVYGVDPAGPEPVDLILSGLFVLAGNLPGPKVRRSSHDPGATVDDRQAPLVAAPTWRLRRVTSSSRSQVHRSLRRAYLAADVLRLSVSVRRSPCKYETIVTQLVTRSGAEAWLSTRLRGLLSRLCGRLLRRSS